MDSLARDLPLLTDLAFIGGQFRPAADGARFDVRNPATGAVIAQVADCGASDAEAAIVAAEAAFQSWRKVTAAERGKVLRRWGELMLAHQDDLALLLTREQGKPLSEARGEVVYAASFLTWFAEEARRAYGEVVPSHRADAEIVVLKEPVGVVAAITPWNFPYAMITRKVGPALAAGCSIIIKPAEDTPLCALALAKLGIEAGVPAGVVNVLPTLKAPQAVGPLMASPVVRKLSFTGSTATGKLLMRQSADTVKRISLELGGNAPLIVFADADINVAVRGTIASKFRNTGQTCVCANRILVEDAIYDRYAEALAKAVAAMKVGNGEEDGVAQGPLINAGGYAKVARHVEDALAKGGTAITGGKPHGKGGLFFEPTVLTGATTDWALASEETFGPVAGLFRFHSEDEAISLANASETGLSAYFFTNDLKRAWRVARALEAGMVGINEGVISTEVAPFGGVKQSGLGREGSRHGLEEYLETKYVLFGGLTG
ncbi:NAD-dependent succinate-semialdehyde dehydrogenase [Pannonibacter sp. SL95]|uniref:NAD-dependent succinate-semialdehyde dehydrogenase n=1 Tax=Pannonibacter sp. SL95 TaxID=2995153 RepID=UPI0022765BA6|nr:NAD-dependent succinate-semialdehyde dehydrogenase [Pannonibacter sp. SL95]MCY1707598.1 NAD-dependent succinate-semialdehyde dehydrogenase [Pannonibacter sp. SL95]